MSPSQSFLQNPYYFMFASLAKPDEDVELHWLKVSHSVCKLLSLGYAGCTLAMRRRWCIGCDMEVVSICRQKGQFPYLDKGMAVATFVAFSL